ncbi:hypothetical protein H8R29_28615 (plasmid) [Priestia megaterium]|uniref:Uncharacterized protein n=1 Tax=Priestia megaterium (strain ATCC 14581 / DSM 32 / CCUG 1817 / JCM 2506 / NBRC 15308 / NCIMB 9376 / NCTC 10342 / NRRL B-14308 / VKM B-512 / Ford 19) TaxID=1348623 RepID=A0A0B6B150_PRIM2|nr:hypothetical protein [Priestia megaterium]AJI25874.1 hypothetical protein BG04_5731 [Priestia megaterium NBRC 15308 = ATCC 14581]KFN07538.1 hypothetical protein DJ91_5368 [Priestia megaterium]KGJ85786.1 hypothetical protein BMT_20440 [Priestia megaterium NBRC 15308 = ATCC 14581]MDR4235197.1 hypothetical protein [Priestia megaterium]MED4399242.1 hypothetical protein [Priestia megaterium]
MENMLSVLFMQNQIDQLKAFHKMPIGEACEVTSQIEKEYQEKQKKAKVDFVVLDNDGIEFYRGALSFGSGTASHVVDHICKTLTSVKMNDQQEARKRIFLERLNEQIPDHLRQSDGLSISRNHILTNIPSSAHHRKWMVGGGILALLILSATSFSTVATSQNRAETIQDLQKQVKLEQRLTNIYEDALLGEREGALQKLSSIPKKNLTEEQKDVYTSLLVSQKNYKEAVQLQGNNPQVVENMIAQKEDVGALKEFQQSFPSPNGAFDLAYHEQRWEDMMRQSGVEMTEKRYEMKAYSYLKLDKVEEAKKEAAHIKNQELNQKIETYEQTKKELEETKKQVEEENKKDQKDEKKIKSLADQQKKQEEVMKNI